VALGGWLASAGVAAAQYPYPPGSGTVGFPAQARPPVSPYLNILQGTGIPAVNYFNFARPALQFQQQLQQPPPLQQFLGPPLVEPFGLASTDVSLLPQQRDPTKEYPRPTGHPAVFMSTGGYFNSLGTIGTPAFRGGQAGSVNRAQAPIGARR
jgi:hypothetical protein